MALQTISYKLACTHSSWHHHNLPQVMLLWVVWIIDFSKAKLCQHRLSQMDEKMLYIWQVLGGKSQKPHFTLSSYSHLKHAFLVIRVKIKYKDKLTG